MFSSTSGIYGKIDVGQNVILLFSGLVDLNETLIEFLYIFLIIPTPKDFLTDPLTEGKYEHILCFVNLGKLCSVIKELNFERFFREIGGNSSYIKLFERFNSKLLFLYSSK